MKLIKIKESTPKCPKCKIHMKPYVSVIFNTVGYKCQRCYAKYFEEGKA